MQNSLVWLNKNSKSSKKMYFCTKKSASTNLLLYLELCVKDFEMVCTDGPVALLAVCLALCLALLVAAELPDVPLDNEEVPHTVIPHFLLSRIGQPSYSHSGS